MDQLHKLLEQWRVLSDHYRVLPRAHRQNEAEHRGGWVGLRDLESLLDVADCLSQ